MDNWNCGSCLRTKPKCGWMSLSALLIQIGVIYMIMIVSILGALCSLGGNILIMLKKKSGWIVWVLGNLFWIIYNFMSKPNLPMIVMYLVYIVINILGYCKWCDKEGKNKLDM